MPDSSANPTEGRYNKDDFKGLVRKHGQGWSAEKYGRMGIYVYLYNRMKGKPTRWGLDNQDVSFQIKDVLEKRFDEVIAEYIKEPIPGIDLTDPAQKAQFLKEINEYNEHAQKVDSPMPNNHKMNQFLQAVADDKNSYYMTIHKSVQEKSGEYMDESQQKASLIYERYKKQREIDKQKYDLRRDNFWTGLKGAGALGGGGLTVGAGVALFLLPVPLNFVAGIAGGAVGLTGLRQFGLAFLQSVAKNIKMRQRLRDLKNKGGTKGDRGLKEIDKAIKYNRDLKKIMDNVQKMGKDGKLPTYAEFEAYIKKNYPSVYKKINAGEYMGNMKKFWEDACSHYETQFGSMRSIMGYIERHGVDVLNNEELAIERDDLYKSRFNVDGKKVKLGAKGQPVMNADGSYVFENGTQTVADWLDTYNKFKIDEKAYKDQMPREYQELKQMATRSLYNVFRNSIFEAPYESDSTIEFANYLENEGIKEYLKQNPDGDKTQILRNAVEFLKIEAKTDRYGNLDHALDGSLGVSIKEQLVKDEEFGEVVGGACEKLLKKDGITDASVSTKIKDVVKMAQKELESKPITKTKLNSVLSEIETISSSSVKNYLKKMVEIKRDEARLTSTDIDKALLSLASGADISSVLNNSEILNIKNEISRYNNNYTKIMNQINNIAIVRNLSTNTIEVIPADRYTSNEYELLPDYKAKLVESLNEQIKADEAKKRNKIRADVLSDIQNGRLNKSEDLQKYFEEFINKINFEQLTTKFEEIRSFYQLNIQKANTPALREYLTMRLSNKIELEYTSRLNNNFTVYKVEGGMDKLRSDVIMIKNNPYLSDDQKRRIMATITPHIQILLAGTVKTMQRTLLNTDKQYTDELYKLLDLNAQQGGFSEFLGEDAPFDVDGSLKPIGQQLRNYQLVLGNKDAFKYSFGDAVTYDGNSEETKLVLRLLLTQKGNLDNFDESQPVEREDISKVITDIKNMKARILSTFSPDTSKYSKGQNMAVRTVDDIIESRDFKVKDTSDKSEEMNSLRAQYVKLLSLKSQAVTALKGQVAQLLKGSGALNPATFLNGDEGSKKIAELRTAWTEVFDKIDNKVKLYQELLEENGFNFGGIPVTSASTILSELTAPTTAYQSAISQTATFDGMEKGM